MDFSGSPFDDGSPILSDYMDYRFNRLLSGGPPFDGREPWHWSRDLPEQHRHQQETLPSYGRLHFSVPQHFHSSFDRAQGLDNAFVNYTETANRAYTRHCRTGFLHCEPMQECECQERRGYRPSSYSGSREGSHKYRDPSFRFDVHFGFGRQGGEDERRRARSNDNVGVPGYTVQEPDDDDFPTFSQLPHQARSRSRGGENGEKHGNFLGWGFVPVTETEARLRTVSTSGSPDHQSPARPPSPHPSPVEVDRPNSTGPHEDTPSPMPLSGPSSPRLPYHQDFSIHDDTQPYLAGQPVDLRVIIDNFRRQNQKLKRKRAKLNRLWSELLLKEEELRFRELKIMGLEAQQGRIHPEFPRHNGFPR
ncbi:MAG: hypothetical protein Q9209_002605 [Squamulea sp. 1 TL-2023]